MDSLNKTPDEDYKRISVDMEALGMDLNSPVDIMPSKKFPLLVNARSYQDGRIEAREGVTQIG